MNFKKIEKIVIYFSDILVVFRSIDEEYQWHLYSFFTFLCDHCEILFSINVISLLFFSYTTRSLFNINHSFILTDDSISRVMIPLFILLFYWLPFFNIFVTILRVHCGFLRHVFLDCTIMVLLLQQLYFRFKLIKIIYIFYIGLRVTTTPDTIVVGTSIKYLKKLLKRYYGVLYWSILTLRLCFTIAIYLIPHKIQHSYFFHD